MKIFICCSKAFYDRVLLIQAKLELLGHVTTLPNSHENPLKEFQMKDMGAAEHAQWKADMLRLQVKKVANNDALLVLNFDKNKVPNYIGGATFLEVYKAFELGKKNSSTTPYPKVFSKTSF